MKTFRKLLCTLMVAMLFVATMASALAEDTITIYLNSKDGGYTYNSFDVNDVKPDSKITSVKSSNKEIIELNSMYTSRSSYYYFSDKTTRDNNPYVDISVYAKKAGKATVTYKVDGEKKTQKFVIKDYTNPVKSFILSGISTKNLKSVFDSNSYNNRTLKKDAKAGEMTFKAASGWKITSVYWEDYTNQCEYEFYTWGGKGVSSVTLNVPEMLKDNEYYINCNFVNTKTNGRLNVSYSIRK